MGIGGRNPLPFRVGGGKSTQQAIYESLNMALGTAYDTSDESTVTAETSADARMMASVWSANARLANQMDPAKMTDMLPRWERILGLRPRSTSSKNRRRGLVAIKFRALGGPLYATEEEICGALLGSLYVQLEKTSLSDAHMNWPGGSPSVLTRWDSTIAHQLVRVIRYDEIVDVTRHEMFERLAEMMNFMRDYTAAWMETDWAWDAENGNPEFRLDEDWNLDGEAFGAVT